MKRIIRGIKALFGYYDTGCAYRVKVKDIVISEKFKAFTPRFVKMVQKREYYRKYGVYDSKVFLNKDFVLVDGYTTYLLCVENGEKYVDVYFVD